MPSHILHKVTPPHLGGVGGVWEVVVWFGLVWSAPSPWPHRLKVSEGLRHGSAKKLYARSYLSPGDYQHMGSAHATIRSPGFGTLLELIHQTLQADVRRGHRDLPSPPLPQPPPPPPPIQGHGARPASPPPPRPPGVHCMHGRPICGVVRTAIERPRGGL